ncbi:MAG: SpoIIE family protein phosphatase [bacterium]
MKSTIINKVMEQGEKLLEDLNNWKNAMINLSQGDFSTTLSVKADPVPISDSQKRPYVSLLNQIITKLHEVAVEFNLVTDIPCKRLCYVGADSFLEGQRCGELMGEVIKASYPEIKIVDIVESNENPEISYKKAKILFEKYPDLSGIYISEGSTPSSVAQAIVDSKRENKIKLVSHDLTNSNINFVKKGVITATLEQEPYAQGFNPVIHLFNHLVNGWEPQVPRLLTHMDVITQKNYREYWSEEEGVIQSKATLDRLAKPVDKKSIEAIRIAILGRVDSEFWIPVNQGILAAKKLLKDRNVQVELIIPEKNRTKGLYGSEVYGQAFQKLISEQYNGIGIIASDAKLIPQINHAVEVGIPVVTLNSEPFNLRSLIHIITNQTNQLKEKNSELEAIDSVVRAINKEIDLENVLTSLLNQTLTILPQAKMGCFLIYDDTLEKYRYAAANGYNVKDLQKIHLTDKEVKSRYTKHAAQVEKGVYVIRTMKGISAQKKFNHLESSKSILTMSVILEGRLEGFLILENMKSEEAFDKYAIQKLLRLREHLVSAFNKAKSLKLLEEKNQNILSSIHYGERIQRAILPLRERIQSFLPEHFILFKPRDIVSGDFYWFNKVDGKIILAVVDCTGHGVPGAFMSMLGNAFLNEIVSEQKIIRPAEILGQLHQEVRTALKQEQEQVETQDGMDACVCALEKNGGKYTLVFAGAKRPLYMIKKGSTELTEIKGDRSSIGGRQRKKWIFTEHELKIQKGDQFYLTTDGFVDQQNVKNRRYGSGQLKNFLRSISDLSMQEQKKVMTQELVRYQGTEEQRDDITIMGVRV